MTYQYFKSQIAQMLSEEALYGPADLSIQAPIYSEYLYALRHPSEITKDKYEIVGATDLVFAESSLWADLTHSEIDTWTETVDFSSYPDRAPFRLQNTTGYDQYLTRLQIHGKAIVRTSGANGSLINDYLKREDDIRRNGENQKKISNRYIFDGAQVDTIADYWYKKCGLKLHMYGVTIKGSCPWYEPGDR
jgi:hypothetical protein